MSQNWSDFRPASPHISQFSPPLRSLTCTRHICWRWSQDMRADAKLPHRRGIMRPSRLRKTNGAGTPQNLAGRPTERSFWGGFAGSPDVSAYRLGPRIGNKLHVGYRVECETSGLGTCRASPSTFLVGLHPILSARTGVYDLSERVSAKTDRKRNQVASGLRTSVTARSRFFSRPIQTGPPDCHSTSLLP